MFSYSALKHFLHLLTGTALAFCLAASPAHASKKQNFADTAERGGLFQPPAAITKPSLVLDTSIPKAIGRKGDALRQNSPDAASATPAVSATPAATAGIVPVKAFEPTKSIESMRLHSLFE